MESGKETGVVEAVTTCEFWNMFGYGEVLDNGEMSSRVVSVSP